MQSNHDTTPSRSAQACLKCRAQKMRCVGGSNPPCVRCQRTGSSCEFAPRSNLSKQTSLSRTIDPMTVGSDMSMEARLHRLERENERLRDQIDGLLKPAKGNGPVTEESNTEEAFGSFLEIVGIIRQDLPPELSKSEAWEAELVKRLWSSFRYNMPGLHFLIGQVSLSRPSRLLAIAILFVAAGHDTEPDFAKYQFPYLQAFGREVGKLAHWKFGSTIVRPNSSRHEYFDDVLGIVMVGLIAVGWVDVLPIWVNIAYRILLDGVDEDRGGHTAEWKGLWEGLRTIDVEHSSLHFVSPSLPIAPTDSRFDAGNSPESATSPGPDIGALLSIMQRRLVSLVSQNLQTPIQRVLYPTANPTSNATTIDMSHLKSWAAEVDEWFGLSTQIQSTSAYAKALIHVNYYLHKVYVYSLALPPSTSSHTIIPVSLRDDLISACRQALGVEMSGFDVWSSWDLVMLTHASLLLLDNIAEGHGEQSDVTLIQYHLKFLKLSNQHEPTMRKALAARLTDASRQTAHSGSTGARNGTGEADRNLDAWHMPGLNSIAASTFTNGPEASLPAGVLADPSQLSFLSDQYTTTTQQDDFSALQSSLVDQNGSYRPPINLDAQFPAHGDLEWPTYLLDIFGNNL